MRRAVWLIVMAMVAVLFVYVSRFWWLRLWGREGLFGLPDLRPQGGLLARWLRGSDAAPFELLIWVVGIFVILTGLQKLSDALDSPKSKDDH